MFKEVLKCGKYTSNYLIHLLIQFLFVFYLAKFSKAFNQEFVIFFCLFVWFCDNILLHNIFGTMLKDGVD